MEKKHVRAEVKGTPVLPGHLFCPCFPETGKVIGYRRLISGVKQVRRTASPQPKPKVQSTTNTLSLLKATAIPKPKPVPKPLVSFVIPTINQVDLVVKCLTSLTAGLSLPAHAFEFVVVDDGSPPPLQEELAKALRPFNGRLLRQKKNTGFAHAVNSGAAVARGRYLCLVNNDLVFPANPGWQRC